MLAIERVAALIMIRGGYIVVIIHSINVNMEVLLRRAYGFYYH